METNTETPQLSGRTESVPVDAWEAQTAIDAFDAVLRRCPGIPESSQEAFAADVLVLNRWSPQPSNLIEWVRQILPLDDEHYVDLYAPVRAVTEHLSLPFEILETASFEVERASDGTLRILARALIGIHHSMHAREQMDFDPNEFLEALDRLCLREGYILDFIYVGAGDSRPFLYARRPEAPRMPSDGLLRYFVWKREVEQDSYWHYLAGVECDGTPLGYFQLAVLDVMGEQFALGWHCCYNDWRIVCSARELASLRGTLPLSEAGQAKKVDLTITVQYLEDIVVVTFVLFSKWRGFVKRRWVVTRRPPHLPVGMEDTTLVPYHCGIFF